MPSRDEILQALVNKVTALEARVAALETNDPWAEEFTALSPNAAYSSPGEGPVQAAPRQEGDHVPALLAAATGPRDPDDPDEDTPEVLEAKRRIEEANANDLQPKLHTKDVKVTPGPNSSVMVTVPAPTKQQEFMRKATAPRVIANLPGLDHELATKAYIEGGPIWLHAFSREHVIGLPDDLRWQFVKDVAMTAPESAHELGADILKETDPTRQSEWASANMDLVRDEHDRRG
jgi:hypothetical protein